MSNLHRYMMSNQRSFSQKKAEKGLDMAGAEVHKQPIETKQMGCLTMENLPQAAESANGGLSNQSTMPGNERHEALRVADRLERKLTEFRSALRNGEFEDAAYALHWIEVVSCDLCGFRRALPNIFQTGSKS